MYSFVRLVTALVRSSVLRAAVSNNCNAFNHTSRPNRSANMSTMYSANFLTAPSQSATSQMSSSFLPARSIQTSAVSRDIDSAAKFIGACSVL